MNIQDEIQKIHHKYGVSEMANYKIQQFVENLIETDRAEQLKLHIVSKSFAKQYAEFCVRCDREGLPLLELDDYIKQYCC